MEMRATATFHGIRQPFRRQPSSPHHAGDILYTRSYLLGSDLVGPNVPFVFMKAISVCMLKIIAK